jgi:hypothetical protein
LKKGNAMIGSGWKLCVIVTAIALAEIRVALGLAAPPDTQPGAPVATAVKLHLKNVTARQALDELGKQTGLSFKAEMPPVEGRLQDARVSVDVDGPL